MDISDLMKTFASGRRMEVLDALLRGETKDEIKGRVPPSTFAFTIDYLKKIGFAEGTNSEVVLTERGHAYLVIFNQFKNSINTLENLYAYFPDHAIYFPDEFFIRLYEIRDSQLITSEPSDVLKPHRVFFDNLRNSREISGVSPLMFPDYANMFSVLAENQLNISLVVTDEIFTIISKYPLDQYENIAIYVVDELPQIAITVTDQFLSIGFFYKSGNYDFTRDLISTSPAALKFGKDLVEYYRMRSRRSV
jgi:predicted transcriptional regulator